MAFTTAMTIELPMIPTLTIMKIITNVMVRSVYWSDWLSCWELLLLDWEAMRANVFQNEVSLTDWSLQEDRKEVKITKERKGGGGGGGGRVGS